MQIRNKPTIQYVIDSAKKSKLSDLIVLCTTKNQEDDHLCQLAKENDIEFFRGSEKDKLIRWLKAAEFYNVDFFVTADGDDLFCSNELIDLAFKQNREKKSQFIQSSDTACGLFTYGIRTDVLKEACKIKDTDDTEMMHVYFTETGICKVEELEGVPALYKRDDLRMTLDYKEDFDFFSQVINNLDNIDDRSTQDILSFLDKNQDVININQHLQDVWKENQNQKTTLFIRDGNDE